VKASLRRVRTSLEELSPEQAALVLSIGLVLGVFPILGCPTVLCVMAAFGLRLNFAALQLLNNISSPLQLVLLLPLTRAGAWLCGGTLPAGGPAARLGATVIHSLAGWACICVPLGILLYFILINALRRCRPVWSNNVESTA
jgi:uncharacterized protein (DUF2062 family)